MPLSRLSRSLVLLAVLAALGLAPVAQAQKGLRGAVTDAETGAPLPSATLQVEGTTRGTITNAEGRYVLELRRLPATVRVRFIGYAPVERRITADAEARQDFRLQPSAVELEGLTVTPGRHPARDIMREVILRKQARRERLETFRADAYNRFTLSNDTGIVAITEALTEWLWGEARGSREIVKGRRATENLDLRQSLPAGTFVTNLYDDNIEVFGHRLIGVTHPEALDVYRFELVGVRALGEQKVFDIAVRPESELTSGFVGRVSVLDSIYALLEVELRPSDTFRFPPPFQHFTVAYRQQFARFGEGFWLPVSLHTDLDVKVAAPGLLAFPGMHVDQVARLTDYAVNVPLPDSLFAQEEHLVVDSAAVRSDRLLASAGAAVPLSAREQRALAGIDSTETLDEAFAPSGPLTRLLNFSLFYNDEEVAATDEEQEDDGGLPVSYGFSPELWFNRVDALHLAAEADLHLGRRLTLHGTGGYKTGLRRAVYGGGARLDLGRTALFAEYEYAVHPRYDSRRYGRFLNSLQTLFARPDYFDYYASERLRVGVEQDVPALWARARLHFNAESHRSVDRTTSYDLFGNDNLQPANPPVEEGLLRSVSATVTFGENGLLAGLSGQRRLRLHVEHSDPDLLGGDFDFTRFEGAADYTLRTFFRRRLLPMTLDVRLTAGTFVGTLPPQRYGLVEASLRPYAPFGVLRTLPNRPYVGSRHVAFFWEHNFRSVPFEVLGLEAPARWGWELILGGGHGRTWADAEDEEVPAPLVARAPDGFHHELTLSLNRLLGLLRIDLSKRLDAEGWAVSFGVARLF